MLASGPKQFSAPFLCLLFASAFMLACLAHGSQVHAQEGANILARKGNAQLHRGENENAIASFSEALSVGQLQIYTKASILNDRALAYTRIKKYERAMDDFNSAIEAFPEFATAYNNRGLLLNKLGFHQEAIKDFNRALALQPKSGAIIHNRANALLNAGAEKVAFKDYGKALTLLNDKTEPHLARGQIHWAHQRRYAALREFNLALENNNNHAKLLYNRGQVYMGLEQTTNAINDIAKAVQLAPNNQQYKMELSTIYLNNGQHFKARQLLTKILQTDPLNAHALILRGRAYGDKGDYNKALNDLDQAVSLTDGPAAYAERALLRSNYNMPDLSAQDSSTAIQKAPQTARSWAALGQAALNDGLIGNAERYFLESLKRDKGYKLAKEGLVKLGIVQPDKEEQIFADDSLDDESVQWTIIERQKGNYIAVHPKYRNLKIHLDLYGPNKPKIIEWTVLTGKYKGFGLLRYDAGSKDKANPFEQVSIVNLKKQKVLSIEPFRWGKKISKWDWKDHDVEIRDPDGITNKVALRTPPKQRRRPKVTSDSDWLWNDGGFWNSKPKTKKHKKRKRVRRKKKKKKFLGIFSF